VGLGNAPLVEGKARLRGKMQSADGVASSRVIECFRSFAAAKAPRVVCMLCCKITKNPSLLNPPMIL